MILICLFGAMVLYLIIADPYNLNQKVPKSPASKVKDEKLEEAEPLTTTKPKLIWENRDINVAWDVTYRGMKLEELLYQFGEPDNKEEHFDQISGEKDGTWYHYYNGNDRFSVFIKDDEVTEVRKHIEREDKTWIK